MQKVREKKEKILSLCIVDELQMMYMGTEEAKILSCGLKDIFSTRIAKGVSSLEVNKLDEEELRKIL